MLLGQADESDIPMGGESWRQGRMAMWKMQCTARLIALRCDGRCSVLRWPMHRSASSAPRGRHVARSVAGISLQGRSKPLLTISNKIGMHRRVHPYSFYIRDQCLGGLPLGGWRGFFAYLPLLREQAAGGLLQVFAPVGEAHIALADEGVVHAEGC